MNIFLLLKNKPKLPQKSLKQFKSENTKGGTLFLRKDEKGSSDFN
jgi:hypothetical protein